jgi:hypothetical protein
MALAFAQSHRRLVGSLALLGMAFYTVLIPWHTVSQASLALAGSPAALVAEPPCHNVATVPGEATKGSHPTGKTHCPICTGFAALHLTLASPAIALPAPPELGAARFNAAQRHLAALPVPAPQSRAPPFPAI